MNIFSLFRSHPRDDGMTAARSLKAGDVILFEGRNRKIIEAGYATKPPTMMRGPEGSKFAIRLMFKDGESYYVYPSTGFLKH